MAEEELQQTKKAAQHLEQATKHLTKSCFRRSVDYTAAAAQLTLAGDAYRAAGDWALAKTTFYRAIDAYTQDGSTLCGGELYEKIAKVAIQQMRSSGEKLALVAEAVGSYEAASAIYLQTSSVSKASEALVKAAAVCEEKDTVEEPKQLYARACALVGTDGQVWYAGLVFPKALEFLVKIRSYEDAREVVQRQIEVFKSEGHDYNAAKSYVNDLVLLFAMHDVAAANEAFELQCQDRDFLGREEFALAQGLVQAYKTQDEELLKATVRRKEFDSLKSKQIARLARKLTLAGGVKPTAVP